MGAKKKGGGAKKGGKGKKDKKPKDAVGEAVNEVEEAERKALTLEADRVFKRTVKEDHDFNEFQQQREKLNYFWIVEKKNLEDKRAELRNKERELQDIEEKHQVEIKIYKQRVKHLLYEQQDDVTAKKMSAEVSLKLAQQDAHREEERELKVDRRGLRLGAKEMGLSHEAYLMTLKQQQDRNITMLKTEFERKAGEVHKIFEKAMKTVRERLDAARKAETAKIEERKNSHIERLMKAHEKAFAEIKNYYNDITHNNLDLIRSLKEEVADMRKREQQDEKLMYEIAQENKKMSEPLRKARQDVERLRQELERYRQEQEQLRQTKARVLIMEERLRDLHWEDEVLGQRFAIVSRERDQLRDRFQDSVKQAQQKSGFRNLILERKLGGLAEEAEKRDACVNEVLSRANLEAAAATQVKGKVENILEQKGRVVADLEQEVARVKTAHARLVRAAEAKLRDFGIPTEELGFLPQVVTGGAGAVGVARTGLLTARKGVSGEGGRGGGRTAGGKQRPPQHVSVTQATVKA
ncbi:unnamed protein product [Ectocarpus sp. 4 AP-2014]